MIENSFGGIYIAYAIKLHAALLYFVDFTIGAIYWR